MSFFTNPFKVLTNTWGNLSTWWKGTTIGQEIDAAAKAALAELEVLAPGALTSITEATAAAILPGIATGNPTAAIVSAGIAAAEAAFKQQSATVSSTTVSTFVSTLHNSIATQAANSNTPAPAAAAS